MKIGIIGAGWYGCHLALTLKEAGHDVEIYEKKHEIFSGISGKFGIRLHQGPHYPRSASTRESCRRGFTRFMNRYPDLVIPHEYSIYGLGARDSDGNPPKIDREHFDDVCEESDNCNEIDHEKFGFDGLLSAHDVKEPSIALGKRLRTNFTGYLEKAGIPVHLDFDVTKLESMGEKVLLGNETSSKEFDKIINASSYQTHVQKDADFPFDMEVVYQPCLALVYKDKKAKKRPFSFIVMDGWFPCLMPQIDNDDKPVQEERSRKYILTHGKWTIMGSYDTASEANSILAELSDSFVEDQIKVPSENEMKRFWPAFADKERFEYIGWEGTVLAKLKTKSEFRSALTYEDKGNVIHIIPGKVSNIFDAEDEVFSLLYKENVLNRNGYSYVMGGVLDQATTEITEKPAENEANTANLRTLEEIKRLPQRMPKTPMFNRSTLIQPKIKDDQSTQTDNAIVNLASPNYSFVLKCIAGILACSTLLAVAILTIPVTGVTYSAMISAAAVVGVSYCGYRLFANVMERPQQAITVEHRPSFA